MQLAIGLIVAVATSFLGVAVRKLERKLEQKEKKEAERDKKREMIAMLTIEGVQSAISLGEANTLALKRGGSNGESEAAMEYARRIKNRIKDFLTEEGVKGE